MPHVKIRGTGSFLPEKIMNNHEWSKYVDTSDEWIVDRAGIKQRHIASASDTASSMGTIAAQRALEAANLDAKAIDLIIVATCTPDKLFPSTACLIQANLNIKNNIIAFDQSAACAGFLYALVTAEQFIRNGTVKNALVIGSEVMSRAVSWKDRGTCVLFADGAGAVVLSADDKPGILTSHLHAQGEYQNFLYLDNQQGDPSAHDQYLHMSGREVFKLAVKYLGEVASESLHDNAGKALEIDWLVPHQANLRIITGTAKKLGLPMEKVIVTVDRHGNTSSASVPLALDTALRDGRIQPGHKVLLEAFGGGMTWGGALVEM